MRRCTYDEWQGTDAEAAQITVISKFCCTYISPTGINVLDGMLSAVLLASFVVFLITFYA